MQKFIGNLNETGSGKEGTGWKIKCRYFSVYCQSLYIEFLFQLSNCICDGSESYDCENIRHNMNRYNIWYVINHHHSPSIHPFNIFKAVFKKCASTRGQYNLSVPLHHHHLHLPGHSGRGGQHSHHGGHSSHPQVGVPLLCDLHSCNLHQCLHWPSSDNVLTRCDTQIKGAESCSCIYISLFPNISTRFRFSPESCMQWKGTSIQTILQEFPEFSHIWADWCCCGRSPPWNRRRCWEGSVASSSGASPGSAGWHWNKWVTVTHYLK